MCGLIAFLDVPRIPGDPDDAMRRALDALAHRGLPGRRGTVLDLDRGIALGHVRLPIVGLDESFDQPFRTGDALSVFVGEIFGFREVFPGAKNDAWAVHSVFAEDSGIDAYRGRDGFWSAVHVVENVAYAVVDYLGQKPLYYHAGAQVLASEPAALLAAVGPQPLDSVYLANVRKWGYDPTGRTPWTTIERLPPGTEVRFDLTTGEEHRFRYYEIIPDPAADFSAELEKAMSRRMDADVPVAVLCSGGLDSTVAALLAARNARRIRVFHAENDEARYLQMIRWPASVESVDVLPLAEFDETAAMRAYGEPVDLGSVLPQHALGRAVRRAGFRVAISGDGADELLGGYRRAAEYDSQASDVWCELPAYHLPRLDRCMMTSAVELRTPYLAPRVVAAALALPRAERTGKLALKRLAVRLGVPSEIIERTKKPLRSPGATALERRYRLVDEFVRMHGKEA